MAESFRRAAEMGADFLELDARRTADGAWVVHHDPVLAGGRPIASLTLREFRGAARDQALTVPELLDIPRGKARLQVDLKLTEGLDDLVALLLGRLSPDDFVFTGEAAPLRRARDLAPDVEAGLSLGRDMQGRPAWEVVPVRLGELFPGRLLRLSGASFISAEVRLARANVLRWAYARGLPVWIWTVDDEPTMARLLADRRVSVLITNRPDLALRLRSGSTPPP